MTYYPPARRSPVRTIVLSVVITLAAVLVGLFALGAGMAAKEPSMSPAEVERARVVCKGLDNGGDPGLIEFALRRGGYSEAEAGKFIGASVAAFCPEHLSEVTG